MGLDRDLMASVRRLDEYDLRRLLMFAGGILAARTGTDPSRPAGSSGPPAVPANPPRVTLRRQAVRCGKKGCTRCPHGPYWYAFWREDGRTRSRYVGRELPPEG